MEDKHSVKRFCLLFIKSAVSHEKKQFELTLKKKKKKPQHITLHIHSLRNSPRGSNNHF